MLESRPGDLFQPGDLLNNTYRIEGLLGRGGTSHVYKARSEISGNLVALKVLKQELAANEDFTVLMAREENIREIRHAAVVRYSENHRTPDGHIYLLMDYVEGPGLDKRLKQGPMEAEDLLVICRRVAQGLQAAHIRNIVHRDLSPDNIILRGGDPAEAVIIDFGIAKDTNPGAQTIVGNEFAGKYSYAAPEQMSGNTDARSDIYSLGALLLANFRGAAPKLGANPMEVVENKQKPLDTEGLPEPFKTLIERMCAPDPNARFQNAGEVLAFLDDPDGGSLGISWMARLKTPPLSCRRPANPPRRHDPRPSRFKVRRRKQKAAAAVFGRLWRFCFCSAAAGLAPISAACSTVFSTLLSSRPPLFFHRRKSPRWSGPNRWQRAKRSSTGRPFGAVPGCRSDSGLRRDIRHLGRRCAQHG
ncbi:serine/threonine-protein kinase [Leisingera sp. NJS201]|uniref:serine/threonine-protein kinase n=1 Tax=Leisingera sp. NJS201 TaxID=2508306 RepID=UPI0020C784B1|nr:serine/threonine-protein kinase [Leisingera sp. NJS201]